MSNGPNKLLISSVPISAGSKEVYHNTQSFPVKTCQKWSHNLILIHNTNKYLKSGSINNSYPKPKTWMYINILFISNGIYLIIICQERMTLTHGHHQDSHQMESGHIPPYPGILMLSCPWLLWEQERCVVKTKVKTDVNIHVFPRDDLDFS